MILLFFYSVEILKIFSKTWENKRKNAGNVPNGILLLIAILKKIIKFFWTFYQTITNDFPSKYIREKLEDGP